MLSFLRVSEPESLDEFPGVDVEVVQDYNPRLCSARAALTDNLELTVSQLGMKRADASKVHIDP